MYTCAASARARRSSHGSFVFLLQHFVFSYLSIEPCYEIRYVCLGTAGNFCLFQCGTPILGTFGSRLQKIPLLDAVLIIVDFTYSTVFFVAPGVKIIRKMSKLADKVVMLLFLFERDDIS